MQLEEFKKAEANCRLVLNIGGSSRNIVKAHTRMARALCALGKFREARHHALSVPSNKWGPAMKKLVNRCAREIEREDNIERQLARKMFASAGGSA